MCNWWADVGRSRVKIKISSLLTSTLEEDISFTFRALYPGNIATNIQWIGSWKELMPEKRKSLPL
jgi:hypothetical protein